MNNGVGAKKILIVEDEPKLASLLNDYLVQSGFYAHRLSNGLEVIPWIKDNPIDLILLDLMLPGKDGIDICCDLRRFSNIPIIMTTARVEEIDRLLGLELGADDYVCKPYSPREVVARVKAIFRRIDSVGKSGESDKVFSVDAERMEIKFTGVLLDLTAVEFRLLASLIKQPGRLFSRDQLLDQIYEDNRIVTTRTVDSHIKNIRKKLSGISSALDPIVSVYGVGYKIEW
jgi:two-component system response regulator BaeR